MLEYPSIDNSSKAPKKVGIAQMKYDGSNARFKYTPKKGFNVFGTRTQLIDIETPFWGEMVRYFKDNLEVPLIKLFEQDKQFRDYREIVMFGEFFGENSFAGFHQQEPHRIILFDCLLGHKQRKLLKPKEFIKTFKDLVEVPEVIYEGNLNDEFIKDVRENKYNLKEGVIFKGNETDGSYFGGVMMCKIKTNEYMEKLKLKFNAEWKKYGE